MGAFVLAVGLAACAVPLTYPAGPTTETPRLTETAFIMADGAALPAHRWAPEGSAKAVILAVHGFNDYGNFIFDAAEHFAETEGFLTYAYDQRGFGGAPNVGTWAGNETFAKDLITVIAILKDRHPDLPFFVLGESFGGAVSMLAEIRYGPDVDGYILSAPAVWGRAAMPWYQEVVLWLSAHTIPTVTLTGRGLNKVPSDDTEMLRAMGRDPKVIKETRVEAIYGLVNTMDAALEAASKFKARALILYGEKDDIVPPEPTYKMIASLKDLTTYRQSFALYENGFHMLLRDKQKAVPWADIAAWIKGQDLPSGADVYGAEAMTTWPPEG